MDSKLTHTEKQTLDKFIQSVQDTRPSGSAAYLAAGLVAFTGLILFAAAGIITLNYLSDRAVFWVFLPGLIGGMGTMLFGLLLLRRCHERDERRRLAGIIRKLL